MGSRWCGALVGVLLAAAASPAAGTTTPRVPGGVTIQTSASAAYAIELSSAVTLPASGLPVTMNAGLPWSAVILARQVAGGTTVSAPYFAAMASVPNGIGHSRTPFYGAQTAADGRFTLPAGHYVLYLLVAPGHRLTAHLSLPGLAPSSVSLWSRVPVQAAASTDVALASAATLTDRQVITVSRTSALAVLGVTSGPPLAHDLAACLLAGSVPVAAEMTCGTSAMAADRESADTGYGAGAIAVVVPKLTSGTRRTLVLRGQTVGVGSGLGITTLRWTWTAPNRTAVR